MGKDISNNFMMIDGNMYDKTAKPVNFEFEGEIVLQCPANTSATHIRIEQKSIHHYGTPHEYFNTREYHFRTQYFSEVRLPLKLFNHVEHVGSDPCSIMEFVFSTVDADGNTCEKIHDFNIAFENTNMKYVTSYSTTSECERGISRVKRMKFNKDFRKQNHHTLTLNVDVKPVLTLDLFKILNDRTRETTSNFQNIEVDSSECRNDDSKDCEFFRYAGLNMKDIHKLQPENIRKINETLKHLMEDSMNEYERKKYFMLHAVSGGLAQGKSFYQIQGSFGDLDMGERMIMDDIRELYDSVKTTIGGLSRMSSEAKLLATALRARNNN